MSQFEQDGVIYEDLGNGQVKVVGYAGAPAQPQSMTIGTPRPKEAPSGYRWGSDGSLQKIPGGPADKPEVDPNAPDLPKGYMWEDGVVGGKAILIPGVAAPGANASGKTDKAGAYKSVIQQIDRLYELYNDGIGSTSGIAGLQDYLPTEANAMFDTAGAALGDQGNAAFKVPGMGAQSDADAARFVAANQPQASDRDGAALEKLRALRQRLENNMGAAGLPAPQWNYGLDGKPLNAAVENPATKQRADESNRDEVLFGQPPSDAQNGGFVPYGGTSRLEPNPQWQGVNESVKGMIIAGRPAQEIKAYMNSKGIAGDATTGIDEAIGYFRKTGKTNFGVDVENISTPMSGFDQFRNNAPQTRLGTAAATAANAGGLGIPQMLAGGEGLDYLRSVNPKSAFAGDVAGVIGGTAALGKAGASVAGKFAPALLGGGKRAALARQVGADATYGGIYGATTEGDPLTGAATAALGSGAGMAIGKGLQKTFAGGGTLAAQSLRARGIPITLGQAMGGMAQRIENAATTIPFVGDTITKRYGEGFDAFNREAFREAGAPIGAQVDDIGAAGLDAMKPQISRAYDVATEGANVALDDQFMSGLNNARAVGDNLPPDLKAKFDAAMSNRVDPIANQQVYYHGSPADIDGPLRPGEVGRLGPGIYLTPEKSAALEYAKGKGIDGVHERVIQGQLAPADDFNSLYDAVPLGRRPSPFTPEGKAYQEGIQQQLRDRGFVGISGTDAYGSPAVNVIDPSALGPAGMSGDQYQQAMRGLAGYKAEMTKPGFEADYRDALSGVQDSLKGVMMRQGGEGVVSGLRRADDAYRNSKVLGKAVDAARNGGRTGEVEMFAPSQLNDASVANARKFGGNGSTTNRPFYDLATTGQKVLPSKLANSGTTERMIAGAGLLGTGTGASAYASGADPMTTAAPVATTSLLMLLGTKKGQKMLVKGLMDRPEVLKKAGGLIGRRKAQRAIGSAGAGVGVGALPYFE